MSHQFNDILPLKYSSYNIHSLVMYRLVGPLNVQAIISVGVDIRECKVQLKRVFRR